MLKIVGLILSLLFCLVSSALAEDIGWATIDNKVEQSAATEILGSAFERDGNRFLVSVTKSQQVRLTRAGISFQLLLSDRDPSTLWLIRPSSNNRDLSRAPSFPSRVADLGNGLQLAELSPGFASEDEHEYHARLLTELSVRFLYIPQIITTDLSQITDFPTDSLISRINYDSLYAIDTRLEAFQTRYIWSDSIDAARDWMIQKCLDWGYTDVKVQPFDWNGGTHYNVVVTKLGYAEPDVVIVVGGHYDSFNFGSDPLVFAPGADDNGSGTTVTLELARVLADVPLRKTIVFMPFSAEESGLVGSAFAAADFVATETNVEVMYNYDMVAYDPDSAFEISVSGQAPVLAYSEFTKATAERVTLLTPIPSTSPGGSDHASFASQGFPIVNSIENNFNFPGWHTNIDISTRLNFDYLTEVAKMAVASIAAVAESAHPTSIDHITDIGDGQSLEIFWTACDPSYQYTIFWGQTSGVYTDSLVIPSGDCSIVINGLTEGLTYYFSVVGKTSSGLPALYALEGNLEPLIVPRTPGAFSASPDTGMISLLWDGSLEADFSHYRIYRQMGQLPYILYKDFISSTFYNDTDVIGQVEYSYRITAVDFDGNESDLSIEQKTFAATFDGGILVVDEMTAGFGVPSQEAQESLFDTIFGNTPYSLARVEEYGEPLSKGSAGRFSSMFWFDDDLSAKMIVESEETIAWYAGYQSNIMIGGLRTMYFWGSQVVPGDIRYDAFGCAGFEENQALDFIGAPGLGGWPTLIVDTNNVFSGKLPNIAKLVPRDSAVVIYTYDSFTDNPLFEGEPVGLLNRTSEGYRILLSFPLSFMTPESARSMITYAKSLFGEAEIVVEIGDADGSGSINILDILYIVDYIFGGGPASTDINQSDVNGSCEVNISDIMYLVDYVFGPGPAPVEGCVVR